MNDESLELTLRNISLQESDQAGENELVGILAQRVAELLDENPDLLFSTLYRLDIYESKINAVLKKPQSDAATDLALLIIDRQREKLRTREKYGNRNSVDWDLEDLE